MPISSLVQVDVEVEVEVGVEVGVEFGVEVEVGVEVVIKVRAQNYFFGQVGGDLESKANLNSSCI